jgi:hypothetical protein
MIDRNGQTEHTAAGQPSLVALTHSLTAEAGFGRTLAMIFSQFDINEPRGVTAQKRTGPFSPENKTALVSWLIA